ncbi:sensor histidine kinase [Chitinophaga solisilvae]|uniref:sensor histidine kinase n=1 Tax=Chitinophaga solisilvae TaxID=1233460 RepID=UPI00136FF676|nr:histidine kinase [Chitinophaga solisilvae]
MKIFHKYIFPGLYGLLVYFTIRLLVDSWSGNEFWRRPAATNIIEISCSILMGYLCLWAYNRLFSRFDKQYAPSFSYRRVFRELLYVFLVNTLIQNTLMVPMAAVTDNGLQVFDVIDINIVTLLYSFIYYGIKRSNTFLQAYISNQLQLEKITNDQLQTELKFLKAQYHPHFLFNALNTIYFQMDTDVRGAKKTVEKFSELLRYQLYDQQQMVSIRSEINYLQHFIDLQQVRSSARLQLQVDIDKSFNGEQVYPLLFLPLVENAFKYAGGKFRISIQMKKQDDSIYFCVENSMPVPFAALREGGIGLENLQRRLALLYPGKHVFTTGIQEDTFCAALKLTLS